MSCDKEKCKKARRHLEALELERDQLRVTVNRGLQRLQVAAPVIDGLNNELNTARSMISQLQIANLKMGNELRRRDGLAKIDPEDDGSRTRKLEVDADIDPPEPPTGPRLVRA